MLPLSIIKLLNNFGDATIMFDSKVCLIWYRVLACLAVVVLACALKNYLIAIISGTALCPYLCSSLFGVDIFFSFPLLGQLFQVQIWVLEKLQSIIDLILTDRWKVATSFVFAPVVEELIYRGPLFLSRRVSSNFLWWLMGIGLSVLFALSHGRNGLALFPLISLSICSLWLISNTRHIWPSIMLHFLHNFFFLSILVYQSMMVSD
jgi:membrane protease YdiL (CAAX protease family)